MPDETASTSAVQLDREGEGLQLRAEKAKYRETIVKSEKAIADTTAPSLESVVPKVADAPKGEVTLGENAGAFGPWRAHSLIDELAKKIASEVRGLLAGIESPRVLLVDDRSTLSDDWTAHHVQSTLARLAARLAALDRAVRDGLTTLTAAITALEAAENGQAAAATPPATTRRRGVQATAVAKAAAPTAAAAGAVATPASALGTAVDLLGLLRTDYTITATQVSTTATELSTLTAAHLADEKVAPVELDSFTTMRPSPTMDALRAVTGARDGTVGRLSSLEVRVAPVEAELESIKARLNSAVHAWEKAVTEKKDDGAIAALRGEADKLIALQSARQRVAAPAKSLIAYARQVVADVDTLVSGLVKASDGSAAPILIAVRRERLDQTVASDTITHVLYVHLDAAAADAVSRRSLLGTSGRIRFLSASNASWLVLQASTGAIAGGGQVNLADLTTFGLEKGTTSSATVVPQSGLADTEDPLEQLETTARWVVFGIVVFLGVVGVLSIVAFFAVISLAVR